MALHTNFLALTLAYLAIGLSLVSASPLPLSSDDSAALQTRQSVCRPSVGCVPFFNGPRWHSFELTIPAVGDPHTQRVLSAGGEVEATVWNRSDGTALLAIHLGEEFELPGHSEMLIQARHGNTAINLNRNTIQLEGEGGIATIPAASISSWREGSQVGNTITLTIRWRLNQELRKS